MRWRWGVGIRNGEENGKFGVNLLAEDFESVYGVGWWGEGDGFVCHDVLEDRFSSLLQTGFSPENEGLGKAFGKVRLENPFVELGDSISGHWITCHDVLFVGCDDLSTECYFRGEGLVHCEELGECAGLEPHGEMVWCFEAAEFERF